MRWRTRGLICLMLGLGAVGVVGCVEPDEGESGTYGVQEQALSEDVGLDAALGEPQLVVVSAGADEVAATRPVDETRTPFEQHEFCDLV